MYISDKQQKTNKQTNRKLNVSVLEQSNIIEQIASRENDTIHKLKMHT